MVTYSFHIFLCRTMSNSGYTKLRTSSQASSLDREEAGLFSVLLFGWMTEIFKTGNKRPLEKSDFLPRNEENKTSVLTEKLQTFWDDERKACLATGKRPKLWKSVVKMIPARGVLVIVLFGAVELICRILQPLLLGFILSNLISQSSGKSLMYVCGVLIGVVAIGKGFSLHLRCYMPEVLGARLSCALKGIIYSKVRYFPPNNSEKTSYRQERMIILSWYRPVRSVIELDIRKLLKATMAATPTRRSL